jgi:WD40 repeat protein
VIKKAPLQTYCSALVFAPFRTTVRKQFEDCIPRWVQRLSKVESDWKALVQTLEGHSDYVEGVAFSEDGLLASTSRDETIKLWDPTSAGLLQTLEDPLLYGNILSFSDGLLASVNSFYGIVKLWDVRSGALLETLELGPPAQSNVVAISNKLLASRSGSGTIAIWDISLGRSLHPFEHYSHPIKHLVFSSAELLARVFNELVTNKRG